MTGPATDGRGSWLSDGRVSIERVPSDVRYDAAEVAGMLARLTERLGWSTHDGGAFGAMVPNGATVLVKPNWVLHENRGPGGFEPLVTHATLVRAVAEALLESGAATVVVGDAPVQGCDFGRLMARTGLQEWADELRAREPRFLGLRDFRRTKVVSREHGLIETARDQRPIDEFTLFDLGSRSLLEPITDDDASFRVTQYDPKHLQRTHSHGRHQYLVASEIVTSDVVVNLPKLKTHKKAGVTCALKNLIGINGNKEYLPHHRVGGSETGGDCYPGGSKLKRALEYAFDVQNSTTSRATRRATDLAARVLMRATRMAGDELGVEGSWSGNDTIWRTCLDLNRILLYGRRDGSLADEPQRRVLNVVDAVVAGHGDGPLTPLPLPLGLLFGGASSTAVDWVGAWLLGYLPERIPIAREAFGDFPWPIARFRPADVTIRGALGEGSADKLLGASRPEGATYPVGWLDAVSGPARGAPDVGPAEG